MRLDDRFFEAMVAEGPGGTDSLWTAHNIRVNSSGVGAAGGDRDAARWYQVGNLSTTPTLTQSGTMFDTAGSNPRFFWMPSIAMNGQGHASLNMSTAGNGRSRRDRIVWPSGKRPGGDDGALRPDPVELELLQPRRRVTAALGRLLADRSRPDR